MRLPVVELLVMSLFNPTANASDAGSSGERLLADLASEASGLHWHVVNDNVMGGRSKGGFERHGDGLHFAGRTNTNGGGFSSIRTGPLQLELSDRTGLRLRVRGDGRRYTWRLTTGSGGEVAFWADFDTRAGEWQSVDIPFAAFEPRFRGSRLHGPELDTGDITGMGVMIYDGLDGPFELRLAAIGAYPDREAFSLDVYRWQKRALVISARDGADEHLAEQQQFVSANRGPFADRDMVLVTLLSVGRSTAGQRELSAGEVTAMRASLGIGTDAFALRLLGKDGSVKLERDAAVPMDDIFALVDTMPMRQQETSER